MKKNEVELSDGRVVKLNNMDKQQLIQMVFSMQDNIMQGNHDPELIRLEEHLSNYISLSFELEKK